VDHTSQKCIHTVTVAQTLYSSGILKEGKGSN